MSGRRGRPERSARRGWLARLGDLDRRWIYGVLAVALVVTILQEPLFPDRPGLFVAPVYAALETLPPGSPVLFSLEYSPSSAPELEPMAMAMTRHALARDLRVCFVSLWPEGNALIHRILQRMVQAEFPGAVAGENYAVLGYKTGGPLLINAIRSDLGSMYPTDLAGRPLSSLPALAGVERLEDFGLVVSFSGGTPGLKEWILFGGDPTGVPVAGGSTGVGSPEFLAYFPRQLVGLLAGLKGAAEYETALAEGHPELLPFPRPATGGMGPQAVAHGIIVLFVIVGNLELMVAGSRRLMRRRGRNRERDDRGEERP
ncbi:MAG: hypothetical protein R6X25_04780 [Candidatus Krumholzibacteriia bacterium]